MFDVSTYRHIQRRYGHGLAVRIEAAVFNVFARGVGILAGIKTAMYRFSSAKSLLSENLEADRSTDATARPKSREAPIPRDDIQPVYDGLPIVFIHYSDSDYLKYILAQARLFNPTSPIYLIGDESNSGYETVDHHLMADYFESSKAFAKVYRHFNTSEYRFECFNFQRWLVLNEFLLANGLSECVYLDTDTLLYTNVSEARKKFADFDFTMSFMTSGSTFFLNRVEALSDLCEFMMNIYSGREKHFYDRMLAHYATFRKNGMGGGACDNTAFDFYRYEKFGSIGEAAIIIDGSFFDPSIDLPHPGLEMENGLKKVIWKDGLPYGIHARTGKEIRFDSLQFHGNTKDILYKYYTGPKLT